MSESCDVAPDGDRALPIIVRWRRGPEILLAVGLIMLAAGSLWVVLAARSVPPSAMRSMGILAVLFLMWSLVRRAWGDSRADPESPRARDLLDRWPLLVAAWAAGGAYLVFFSPTLSPLAMRIIGLVGLSFFGFLGAAWFNFRRQHPVALRLAHAVGPRRWPMPSAHAISPCGQPMRSAHAVGRGRQHELRAWWRFDALRP